MEHTILHLENSYGFEDINNNRQSNKHGHELKLFSYASIMEATNDFSSTNKLGEGGFGPVYKVPNKQYVLLSRGYMPPEYAMNGVFSRKSDVYGYGVLMLEIVSGRRNNSFNVASNPINLVGHAWELWKEGRELELVDPAINDSAVKDQVLRCIHVGLLSVEKCPVVDRPTMLQVSSMLSNSNEILPSLKRPAFYLGGKVNAANESSKNLKTDSKNDLTISDVSAR
ncbi:hypothetical protein RIF29_38637 [Crotalaria pallida]|uniref:Serine-threonine/tyrosine-protein kinase catalytic domain-containing protein n=1 Tax=Crotalaria pallida TaxID=3830 RepID=A0AAN9HLQ9_CROPI